jgi:hypothetical protein
MLKDLERHFTQKGWYNGTHRFITFFLEGGFEAFSGRASETWEYRWVIIINNVPELTIPSFITKGKVYESLDDLADRVLQTLLSIEKGNEKSENLKEIFVDWNKYSIDEICDYLDNKYKFQSSGDALAINKLVDFYRKNIINEPILDSEKSMKIAFNSIKDSLVKNNLSNNNQSK